MHAVFDFAFVLRSPGFSGADQKVVMQTHPAIGFSQHRIMDERLQHGRFEIVGHDALGHAAEAFKGAPMQCDPGRGLLVKDQFGVLVTAVAQGRDKHIRGPQAPVARMIQLADRAKVHLQLFAGRGVNAHDRLGRMRIHAMHIAAYRRVAAGVPVILVQTLKDGRHFDALIHQTLNHILIRLHARGDGPWLWARAEG